MPRITSVKQRQLTVTAPDQSKERVVARLGSLPVATYSTAVSSNSLIGVAQPLTVTVTTSNVSDGTQLRFSIVGDSRDSFDPNTGTVTVSGDEAVISTTTVSNLASGSASMEIAKAAGTVVAVTEVISVSISAVSPANTSPPSISGTQTIGSVLTCSPGTWTGVPSPTFTYQWRRNSLAISSETSDTYSIVDQDFDTQISCAVTATNIVGSVTEVSNSTSAIPASAPVNTALPTVSGSALVGSILTSSTGTWTGAPSPTFTYQWQRDTVDISGAANSTYTIVSADAGNTLRCVVTATNSVAAVSATSQSTISIVSLPANTSPPSISGTQTIGSVLTCSPGTWTGVPSPTFTYQWRRNSLAISGSTGSTYSIVDQDFDTQISCAVTATNVVGSVTEISNSTSAIPASAPVNTALPTVSGSATVGATLTCSTGTWTGAPSPTFTYQWQRGTTNISGATSSTYVVQLADVGNTIRCVVTATNVAGSASANTANTASVPLPAVGSALQGGFFAGQISTTGNGVATHYLIVAPASSGENSSKQWKTSATATSGTTSVIDGPANTAAMIAAGAASHPAADFCNGLSIGGFSDWYMPALNELEVCYFNLKPTTTSNSTFPPGTGTNTNAVPSRGSGYTAGTPAQTTATDFQIGNTEAFEEFSYWSSTESTATTARRQSFFTGNQSTPDKRNGTYVRAVRRIAV